MITIIEWKIYQFMGNVRTVICLAWNVHHILITFHATIWHCVMVYCSEVPMNKSSVCNTFFLMDWWRQTKQKFYFYFWSSLHDIFLLTAIFIYLEEGQNLQNAKLFCTLFPSSRFINLFYIKTTYRHHGLRNHQMNWLLIFDPMWRWYLNAIHRQSKKMF